MLKKVKEHFCLDSALHLALFVSTMALMVVALAPLSRPFG